MAHDRTPVDDTQAAESNVPEAAEPSYEHVPEEEWPDESAELPRRPRRRLLTPVPLALLGVLIIACGFIAGVLVEKGQTGSSSSSGAGAGLAARFAALRGAGASASGTGGASKTGAAAPAGGALAGGPGGTGGGGATAGQVAYIAGDTLYVTTTEGNTVKVTTSAGSTVTKTVKASVKGIHPGETVLVTGATGANGAINAESIRVGASAGGGLGAQLGGSASSGGSSGGGRTGGGGGAQALFGNGG
jgi:hypothetical protein